MERNEAAHIIEAILFVAGEPVGIGDVAAALGLTEMETIQTVEEMQRQYDLERRGVTLRRYGDHLRMETRQEYAPYVERLLQPVQRQSLTQTAMETLAVIAYRQPVTKAEIRHQGRGGADSRRKVRLLHPIAAEQGTYQGSGPQGSLRPSHSLRHHGSFSGALRSQRHPRTSAPPCSGARD